GGAGPREGEPLETSRRPLVCSRRPEPLVVPFLGDLIRALNRPAATGPSPSRSDPSPLLASFVIVGQSKGQSTTRFVRRRRSNHGVDHGHEKQAAPIADESPNLDN